MLQRFQDGLRDMSPSFFLLDHMDAGALESEMKDDAAVNQRLTHPTTVRVLGSRSG